MMAQNVKNGLEQYITNPYLIEEINNNYETLKYDLSKLDANLKDNIMNANYNIIVVDNDALLFLEKYNLKVISLEDNDNLTEPKINEVKKLITDGVIKYIYSLDKTSNDKVKAILNTTDVELLSLNGMNSIDAEISNNNDNYLTIMNENIELLKKELLK